MTFQTKSDVKSSKVWSRVETKTLLKAVEGMPELWDGTHADYKDRVKKADAKERLAAMFSTSALEIHRKLHNMRTQVNNELRKVTKKAHCKITWDLFDAAKFIVSTRKSKRPQEILDASGVSSRQRFKPSGLSTSKFKEGPCFSSETRGFTPDNTFEDAGSGSSKFEETPGYSTGKWFDEPGSNTSQYTEYTDCPTNQYVEDSGCRTSSFTEEPGCSTRQYMEGTGGSSRQLDEDSDFRTCPNTNEPGSSSQPEDPVSNTSHFMEDPSAGSTSKVIEEPGGNRRKRTRKDEVLERALDIMNKPDDDFQHFGNFVASSLRNLRSELRQRQMKRKIQTLILEIEELDEFDQMSRTSNTRY